MKYILIIIIILFLLIKFYNLPKINNFSNINNVKLYNNEYLKHFNNLDYKLRNCNKDICLNKYNNFYLNFTNNEKNKIKKITHNINLVINRFFYKNIFKFKFLKVKNSMEKSLPHTRESYVILSEKWFDKIFNINNILEDSFYFKLFFHEIFHIFQRNNPNLINILYKYYWNLIKFNKKIPIKIKNIIRTNPDALPNNNWLFKINNDKYILPLCIYLNNSVNITNTKNVYYELDKNLEFININKYYDLFDLKNYSDYFGINNSNNYHPNELSSSIFENIMYNLYNNLDDENNLGYKKLKEFLIKYCYLKKFDNIIQ